MGNPYNLLLQAIKEQKAEAKRMEGLGLSAGQAQLLCIAGIEEKFNRLCIETSCKLDAK